MKKFTIAFFAAIFLAVGAQAQSGLGYGLKAGVNFPSYSVEKSEADLKNSTNFYVTGYLDAPITQNLYVQPGVSLQGKGAKFASGSFAGEDFELTQNTMWLEVPVNLVGKIEAGMGNLFLGAGPYVAFGLSGKNKFSTTIDGIEDQVRDFKFGKDNTLKNTDFGINFTAGYEFGNGLQIHGGYGLGLTNIVGKDLESLTGDVKNRVWSIGIGFGI